VIVPVTAGEMTIVAPGGERSKAQLGSERPISGNPAFSTCLNETASEIVFLEVELNLKPRDFRFATDRSQLILNVPQSSSRKFGAGSGRYAELPEEIHDDICPRWLRPSSGIHR